VPSLQADRNTMIFLGNAVGPESISTLLQDQQGRLELGRVRN